MQTKDRPRSTRRRALVSLAVLGSAVGVTAAVANADTVSTGQVRTMASAPAAVVDLGGPAWHQDAWASVSTTTTVPAPHVYTHDEIASALTYLAAVQAKQRPAAAPAAARAAAPVVDVPAAAADPAPAPAAAPASTGDPVSEAIATYFGDRFDKAMRVASCESSLNPNAVSAGGGNYGLFQINKVHQDLVESMGYSWDQIFDPYVNAAVARHLFDSAGGWGPWACRGA